MENEASSCRTDEDSCPGVKRSEDKAGQVFTQMSILWFKVKSQGQHFFFGCKFLFSELELRHGGIKRLCHHFVRQVWSLRERNLCEKLFNHPHCLWFFSLSAANHSWGENLGNRLLGKSTFFTLSGCSLWNGTLLACWMPSPWFGLLRFVLPARSCQLFLDLFNDGCNGITIQIQI